MVVTSSKSKPKCSLTRSANLCLFAAAALVLVGVVSSPVQAQATGSFDQEVEKVEDISNVIAGIVATMTDVTILPMGISASMRTFRHIVLANV